MFAKIKAVAVRAADRFADASKTAAREAGSAVVDAGAHTVVYAKKHPVAAGLAATGAVVSITASLMSGR